jgi:hypothetical protein
MALPEFHHPVVSYNPVDALYQPCSVCIPLDARCNWLALNTAGFVPASSTPKADSPHPMNAQAMKADMHKSRIILRMCRLPFIVVAH